MGNVKYSKIKTSNGDINFNKTDLKIHQFECSNFEYIKIYNLVGDFKVYINNSDDFIFVNGLKELELKDFAINNVKIEFASPDGMESGSLQYYLCK